MILLWRRIPLVVRAVLTGLVVAAVGTTPWAVLVSANSKYWSAVPWAVPPTALYLWLFWRYVRGAGWPRSTAEARRTNCRAYRLSEEVWGAALFAGGLGLVALVLFLGVVNRLVRLPAQSANDVAHVPFVTLVSWLLMGSVVAGIAEESSFRGYMQGPIERRHGPVVAILVTGSLFGFAHFTHPEVTLILMPYYLAVAAIYGALAYLTNSILPSVVLHAGGNALGALDMFGRGRAEWRASSSSEPLIWETGTDASFWISCVSVLVVGAAVVWAYARLATVARKVPDPERWAEVR
jgi:membrane protease YdiL (CAAX protease family)